MSASTNVLVDTLKIFQIDSEIEEISDQFAHSMIESLMPEETSQALKEQLKESCRSALISVLKEVVTKAEIVKAQSVSQLLKAKLSDCVSSLCELDLTEPQRKGVISCLNALLGTSMVQEHGVSESL